MVKNTPVNEGDARHVGLIPGPGRSHGEWQGNPLQYSYLENPMDRRAWWATVHGVEKAEATVHVHTHPVSQMRKLKLQQGKKLVQVTQYRQQSWNPNLNLSDSTPIF